MVTPDIIGAQLIERDADMLVEMTNCLQIGVNGRGRVVATDKFVPQSLHECCHRDLLSL